MNSNGAVLITDNPYDYFLAAAAHAPIAEMLGLKTCFPVQLPSVSSALIDPLVAHYNLQKIEFGKLFEGQDTPERSKSLASRLRNSDWVLELDAHAGTAAAATAIFHHAANTAHGAGERGEHVVFVRSQSSLAPAAALYAALTGKQLRLVNAIEEALERKDDGTLQSVILVDDFATFNKRLLQRLIGWRGSAAAGPPFGILTAYSPAMFTCLIWRALEYRASKGAAGEATNSQAEEYKVISDHGNESHMHYSGRVLCGALAPELRGNRQGQFDCEWSCPHEQRFPASQLAVHHLIISSCNTFTLGDGLVPPEYSLLLNLLNGWPISVIAPLKHAITKSSLGILADALVDSGSTLGQITQCLNSIAPFGNEPDAAYILLGDPEVAITAKTASIPKIQITGIDSTFHIDAPQGRVFECELTPALAASLARQGRYPVVLAARHAEDPAGLYFAFASRDGSPAQNLVLFSNHSLAPHRIELVLTASKKIGRDELDKAMDALTRIRNMRVFSVEPGLLKQVERSLAATVGEQMKSTGYIEPVRAKQKFESPLVDQALTRARHTLLLDFYRRSAQRLWLNHNYSAFFPQITHDSEVSKQCDTCGNDIHRWQYEDPLTEFAGRNLDMCPRCGIIADEPMDSEIELHLDPINSLEWGALRHKVHIRNNSHRTVTLTCFLQFHHWKELGVEAKPAMWDATMEPVSSLEQEVLFTFERPLPDYIHDVMAYALTDKFDLYNKGQRATSKQRGLFSHIRQEETGKHSAAHAVHAAHRAAHAGAHAPPPADHAAHAANAASDAVPTTTGSAHEARHSSNGSSHNSHSQHGPGAHSHAGDGAHERQPLPADAPYLAVVEPHAALFRYLRIAQKRFRTLVLSQNARATLGAEKKFNTSMHAANLTFIDRFVECDTLSAAAMYEALGDLRSSVAGVLPGGEAFQEMAVGLGRKLGFDYVREEDARAHHLKTAMKLNFREHGVPTARFFIVREFEEAQRAWEELGRDCMLKMVDLSSSVNIFRARNEEEFRRAWETIVETRRKYQLSPEVILEEFIEGRELSIEGYVQDGRVVPLNFCEKLTTPTFAVVGHYLPAMVSKQEEEALRAVAQKVVQAVNMKNTVFHIEVHLRQGEPYVIECTCRPPGQHMVELMHRCYGFDFMDISISLATGQKVEQAPTTPKKYYALLAFYSRASGVLQQVTGLEELERRGGLVHMHLEAKPGDAIQSLSSYRQKYGFLILEDDTAEGVREKSEWMRNNVRFELSTDVAPTSVPVLTEMAI